MKLNLTLFDGGAGAGAAAGAAGSTGAAPAESTNTGVKEGSQGAAEGATGKEVADPTQPAEDPEARRQAYRNAIEQYKDLYQEDVQGIIDRRLKGTRESKEKLDRAMGFINILGNRYGITDGNIDNIQKAVEADDAYWEEAAAKEGLSTEQYKHMKKLEAENAQFREAKDNAERLQQREQMYQKWNAEAQELSKLYKGFDLNTEVQNPDFVKLLGAGIPMKTIFETLHHDEILSGAMAYTAKQVAKKQIDAIKSGQNRPSEGAAGGSTSFPGVKTIENMTGDQIKELARRSLAGETIDLSHV